MNADKTIMHQMTGDLFVRDGHGALALRATSANFVWLRYGLPQVGNERLFFPHLLLDDWGNQITGLKLYQWARDNGIHFPRAELFGYDFAGNPDQLFLRDIEYYLPTLCYAYAAPELPIDAGIPLQRLFVYEPTCPAPKQIDCPDEISPPLSYAKVSCWQVDPSQLSDHGYLPAT